MDVFGFCEMDDCWFMFGVYDVVEIQYGVVHSPFVKCHGVDDWVSIGCVDGFLGRGCWGSLLACGCGLLGDGGCVVSGKELV